MEPVTRTRRTAGTTARHNVDVSAGDGTDVSALDRARLMFTHLFGTLPPPPLFTLPTFFHVLGPRAAHIDLFS